MKLHEQHVNYLLTQFYKFEVHGDDIYLSNGDDIRLPNGDDVTSAPITLSDEFYLNGKPFRIAYVS